jgi:hypothetical protein
MSSDSGSHSLRPIAVPFVAAAPAGARVRTRLRVSPQDAEVLRATGAHLGSLAGRDLAARCAEGRLDARGRAQSRAARKRALTAQSSSRWAGTITRTSEGAWQLADRNLRAEHASLRARARTITARLAVPAGHRQGRERGYVTAAERHAKTIRLKALQGRLARVEAQIAGGANQDHPASPARTKETRHPARPPAAPGTKTGRPPRITAGNQAGQHRPGPPTQPIPTIVSVLRNGHPYQPSSCRRSSSMPK